MNISKTERLEYYIIWRIGKHRLRTLLSKFVLTKTDSTVQVSTHIYSGQSVDWKNYFLKKHQKLNLQRVKLKISTPKKKKILFILDVC